MRRELNPFIVKRHRESVPPAIAISTIPARSILAASNMALPAEEQAVLMVVELATPPQNFSDSGESGAEDRMKSVEAPGSWTERQEQSAPSMALFFQNSSLRSIPPTEVPEMKTPRFGTMPPVLRRWSSTASLTALRPSRDVLLMTSASTPRRDLSSSSLRPTSPTGICRAVSKREAGRRKVLPDFKAPTIPSTSLPAAETAPIPVTYILSPPTDQPSYPVDLI